eukprot:gene4718-biopygen7022
MAPAGSSSQREKALRVLGRLADAQLRLRRDVAPAVERDAGAGAREHAAPVVRDGGRVHVGRRHDALEAGVLAAHNLDVATRVQREAHEDLPGIHAENGTGGREIGILRNTSLPGLPWANNWIRLEPEDSFYKDDWISSAPCRLSHFKRRGTSGAVPNLEGVAAVPRDEPDRERRLHHQQLPDLHPVPLRDLPPQRVQLRAQLVRAQAVEVQVDVGAAE